MPLPHSAKLPVPKSEDEFEDLCVDALRIRWKAEPQRNGRRGQRQQGVDIFAEPTRGQFLAAQCKNMESVDLATVQHEAALARGFLPPLTEFVLVLSGPRDANLQLDVRVHYAAHPEPFGVGVLFWEDIVNHVAMDPAVVRKHWPWVVTAPPAVATSVLMSVPPSIGILDAPSAPTKPASGSAMTAPSAPTAIAVDHCPEPVDTGARAPLLAGLARPSVAPPLRVVHVWPYSIPEALLREREVEARTLDALPGHAARDDLLLPRQLAKPRYEDRGVVWREWVEDHPAIDRTLAVGSDGSVAFAATLWEAHHTQLAWGVDGVGLGSCIDVLVGTMAIARRVVASTGRTPRLWVALTLCGASGRRFVADGDATSAATLLPGTRSRPIPAGFLRTAGQFDLVASAATMTPMIGEMIQNLVYKTEWRPPNGFVEMRTARALTLAEWR